VDGRGGNGVLFQHAALLWMMRGGETVFSDSSMML
jgi:hypothetical protein